MSSPSLPAWEARCAIARISFLSSQQRENRLAAMTVLCVLCEGNDETPTREGDSDRAVKETTGIAETVFLSDAERTAGTDG